MTPQESMNVPPSATANPSLSSQISSGLQEPPPEQKPAAPEVNPAEELINRFGPVYKGLKDLASSYPSASNEFSKVEDALKTWLASASDAIATSGRESANY